ncbi:MAG TPA: hypothetical protein H9876_02940 [Candidatus Limosilactobacillus merdipullorum]|uniref:Uncharacterized protein n=1 Tax=Candidatus Limosilactobacillus merdipullorum TaxID=2838653 RepID=A0A9D1QPR4_9LACO|nr:hypothetical protein [Candidatus Limosilactobacillus merdipullorum]
MEAINDDKTTMIRPTDIYGHITKAVYWYGNPYMNWHDPRVPGGKWGQQLTINEAGDCLVQSIVFNDHVRKEVTGQPAEHLQMTADQAAAILEETLTTLNYCGHVADDTDSDANQTVTLTNDDGERYVFVDFQDTEPLAIGRLSMKVRDVLNRADLLVMDGRSRDDFIEQLTIKFVDTDGYTETLTLDRDSEKVTYFRKPGDGTDVTTVYHMPENVSAILDNLNPADFTETIPGLPDDVADDDDGFGAFTCTVTRRNLEPITFGGDYEKYSLPQNWSDLMDVLRGMVNITPTGALFAEGYYQHRRRRTSDVIYLGVQFSDGGREYNYLTDDNSIDVGDQIVVPVGSDDTGQVVTVSSKNYYQPEDVPFPLDQVKRMIGKADDLADNDPDPEDLEI